MVEQTPEDAASSWARVTEALTGEKTKPSHLDAFAITGRLAFDRDNETSLITSLTLARDNARQVREALSNEVWENLNRLYLRLSPVTMDSIWVHTPARLFREALEDMHALEGVTYSTLSHGEGWYFLELGPPYRAGAAVGPAAGHPFQRGPESRKQSQIFRLAGVAEILHRVRALYQALHRLHPAAEDRGVPAVRRGIPPLHLLLGGPHVRSPGAGGAGRAAGAARGGGTAAGRLKSAVDFGQVDELMTGGVAAFIADITKQCEQIHKALYSSYITYGAETVL